MTRFDNFVLHTLMRLSINEFVVEMSVVKTSVLYMRPLIETLAKTDMTSRQTESPLIDTCIKGRWHWFLWLHSEYFQKLRLREPPVRRRIFPRHPAHSYDWNFLMHSLLLGQFSANVCCGQTAGWIKTPLGTEVDLGPGHIVLDGVPAVRRRGIAAPLDFTLGFCHLLVIIWFYSYLLIL